MIPLIAYLATLALVSLLAWFLERKLPDCESYLGSPIG